MISISQLDDEGYVTTFVNGCWKVTRGAMVIARGNKIGTLYMTANNKDIVAATNSKIDSKVWQCILGHMSEKGIRVLAAKGKLANLKSIDIGLCEGYILGKQKRVTFSKVGRSSKMEKLKLVHIDVWGPSPIRSLGGLLYYVTFIDDST